MSDDSTVLLVLCLSTGIVLWYIIKLFIISFKKTKQQKEKYEQLNSAYSKYLYDAGYCCLLCGNRTFVLSTVPEVEPIMKCTSCGNTFNLNEVYIQIENFRQKQNQEAINQQRMREEKRKVEEYRNRASAEYRRKAEEDRQRKEQEIYKKRAEEIYKQKAEAANKQSSYSEYQSKQFSEEHWKAEEAKWRAEAEKAKRKAEEAQRLAEIERQRKEQEEAKRKEEQERQRRAEEEKRKREQEEARRRAEQERQRRDRHHSSEQTEEEAIIGLIKDAFDTFELPYDATFADVKKKRVFLLKFFHPDHHYEDKEAERFTTEKAGKINEAYEILKMFFEAKD